MNMYSYIITADRKNSEDHIFSLDCKSQEMEEAGGFRSQGRPSGVTIGPDSMLRDAAASPIFLTWLRPFGYVPGLSVGQEFSGWCFISTFLSYPSRWVKTDTDSTTGLAASMILSRLRPLAISSKPAKEINTAISAVAIFVPNFVFMMFLLFFDSVIFLTFINLDERAGEKVLFILKLFFSPKNSKVAFQPGLKQTDK